MQPPLYPLSGSVPLTRRSFVVASASFAAAALCSSHVRGAVMSGTRLSGYPFSLGVASGDPAPDGFVIWTRLAPQPLEIGGGMPAETIEVAWEVSEDEVMTRIVRRGTVVANPAWAHSVHVEVAGLRPECWYWYRFHAAGEASPTGRARTLCVASAMPPRLRFAFVSCQKYEVGYFTAFEHLAREDIDLIVHLGDYIYEGSSDRNAVRPHALGEAITLEDYRRRYALYKSDPALQAAHAMAPWIVTWDDHEVANNYAGAIPDNPARETTGAFLRRRAAAYQAYFEHMPLRRSALPSGPDMLLYRRLPVGRLVSFHVLDTRQYRTDQPLGDGWQPSNPVLLDPKGTIMGAAQRQWLFDGLESSSAAWNVMAQQVMVAAVDRRVDRGDGDVPIYHMDKWTGYEFERRRLLRHLRERHVHNPVVLTGDIHANWANELVPDFDRPDGGRVGVEFVGTSITSSGDGVPKEKEVLDRIYSDNPFVKFHNEERGYVCCEVSAGSWRADYRTVPYVTRRGAPLNTRATFLVETGRAQLNLL